MKNRIIAAVVAVITLSSCFSHQFTVGRGASTDGAPVLSEWRSHWIYGLFGTGEVNVAAVCPSGNATIKDYHSFVNLIIGALIGWIWWPTTVEVYCDGRSASLSLTPEQMRAIGRSADFERLVSEVMPTELERLVAARENSPAAPVCTAR